MSGKTALAQTSPEFIVAPPRRDELDLHPSIGEPPSDFQGHNFFAGYNPRAADDGHMTSHAPCEIAPKYFKQSMLTVLTDALNEGGWLFELTFERSAGLKVRSVSARALISPHE